ncbi:hypothetical protein ACIBHX_46740 [Nonomuraea sp. NPDC050536]|uniref:hypothetical protein n=1 Tax=Nonomuraea sp. NPDC050536 TaxID=3364366 RepID=UPI0037C61534
MITKDSPHPHADDHGLQRRGALAAITRLVRPPHVLINRHLRALAEGLDQDLYTEVLVRLYGWHAPATVCLQQTTRLLEQPLPPRALARIDALEADLDELDVPSAAREQLPRCRLAPPQTRGQAVGLVVTLAGAALGIAHLVPWASPHAALPTRFLRDRGLLTWQQMAQQLEALPKQSRAQAGTAALAYMTTLADWLAPLASPAHRSGGAR